MCCVRMCVCARTRVCVRVCVCACARSPSFMQMNKFVLVWCGPVVVAATTVNLITTDIYTRAHVQICDRPNEVKVVIGSS